MAARDSAGPLQGLTFLICKKTFKNIIMKSSRMSDNLKVKHPEKANKDLTYFCDLKIKLENLSKVKGMLNHMKMNLRKVLLQFVKFQGSLPNVESHKLLEKLLFYQL